MIEDIRKHIELKLSEADLQPYPFPHLIVERFFPDEVFAKILEYNPFHKNVGKEWITKKNSANLKTNTPYSARKQINLNSEQSFIASEQEKKFWNQINRLFF